MVYTSAPGGSPERMKALCTLDHLLYEWHPPQQHWRPMVLLDPRGGEWLRDPHRPETWEVGLGGTQQVWVADSW